MQDRLNAKTPEVAFLHMLKNEFGFSPRVSSELLNVAQEMLQGDATAQAIRPGQIRLVAASAKAPFGPPLTETDKVEVTLTIDAGAEDAEVQEREGSEALRQGRILRILDEALAQGGVLTQEDLARALGVNRRTVIRDVKALKAAGHLVHTRGQVKGVGRGQTHKVRIIELWLDREGYDKIARWVHHTPQSIKRYVSTFLRIVVLHRQGTVVEEIAFLTNNSVRLVQDYLAVYQAALAKPHRREKLLEEQERVTSWSQTGRNRRKEAAKESVKRGEVVK
jgi:DNA-binding Lrp family transcriptional regulator